MKKPLILFTTLSLFGAGIAAAETNISNSEFTTSSSDYKREQAVRLAPEASRTLAVPADSRNPAQYSVELRAILARAKAKQGEQFSENNVLVQILASARAAYQE